MYQFVQSLSLILAQPAFASYVVRFKAFVRERVSLMLVSNKEDIFNLMTNSIEITLKILCTSVILYQCKNAIYIFVISKALQDTFQKETES